MKETVPGTTGDVYQVIFDVRIYPVCALLKTAYWFTGKCFVHLQFQDEHTVLVCLKAKPGVPMRELPGEFANHLLDQTLREKLGKETEAFRNLIVAHALSDTCLIRPELESAEPFEDPLAVARPDETAGT